MRMREVTGCFDCGRPTRGQHCASCRPAYVCRACGGYSKARLKYPRWCPTCRAAPVVFRSLRRELSRGPRPADLAERIQRYERRAAAGEPLFP
jgi:hypothetical protein